MLFERIEATGLSHYSYMLGCEADHALIVIDPRRDTKVYQDFAASRGHRIVHILETHIHADYASGAFELSQKTDATVHESAYDRGETYEIRFAHEDLLDGDTIEVGAVRIKALHTPGHTPEHLSFLVYDLSRSENVPQLMLSGDFLFVGSVGRPDLLGEGQKDELARSMFHSVTEVISDLPDGIEVYPAHGAGSMCGAGMGGRPHSTLGFERATNPYFNPSLDENAFVRMLLGSVPPFPPYYRRMKQINAEGPKLGVLDDALKSLSATDVRRRIDEGAVVVDLRDQTAFGGGHIPGSFGIGCGKLLPVWASWLVPYETPIVLVASNAEDAASGRVSLARVGLDDVVGRLEGGIDAWEAAGEPLATLPQIDPQTLHSTLKDDKTHLIDVRSDSEWDAGHIADAHHVFGGTIETQLDELPGREAPIVVMCGGGYRSTAVASVLQRHGFSNVKNATGGMGAWNRAGLPTT